ncbi:MAG: MmgE/PrpD family protein [Rhizobiales bacterium]|nr:MmgE/PrpD family protein [Hyphomicrobiales bacterium]
MPSVSRRPRPASPRSGGRWRTYRVAAWRWVRRAALQCPWVPKPRQPTRCCLQLRGKAKGRRMLLRELAERIGEVTYERLPPPAVTVAKQGILDTVGVALAGAQEDTTAVVTSVLRKTAGEGPALIFGTRDCVDVLSAALINGTAAHALDFDDCSNSLGGHPSAPILPALFAIAPGSSGKAFIAAYAAGIECETRLARAVNFHHYEKGWHPTATLGTFGSAAACGHLLALNAERLAIALALAASMASGIKANFATMTKPFHVGHTTRNGLLAALLAKEGMTANTGALEHRQGFFAVYNGPGSFKPDRVLEHWADPFDLIDPGIAFKRHPCCASTHPAVDAMLHLREAHRLSPERVAKVESWTHPRRLAHTNRPHPQSGLDGKFSIQYALTRALMHGIVSIEHFSDAAVRDPAARALMARVTSTPDPAAKSETIDHFYCRLRITTTSGEVFQHFVDRPVGRDRDHPLPPGALEAKFRDCAKTVLDAAAVETLLTQCNAVETLPDMSDVLNVIASGVTPPAVATRSRAYA